ncbi:MAG: CoA-binding protein [Betaproteobacteria bacterium]|nr:CoA-binding protein [Betaproteobacteria bacterium]
MTPANSLDLLFRPRSVAIIGASPAPGNPRNSLLRILVQHGFDGRVYPVSPNHPEVEGFKAWKSVAELPEAPDVALVITPAATVPGLIAECGAKGIRNAIVFSAGFEETNEGRELAVRLAEAARRHGVTVLGPNCQGLWSVRSKAMLTYSPAASTLERTQHAPIAIVSQSGALGGALGGSLHRNGLGCAYMIQCRQRNGLRRARRAGLGRGARRCARRRRLHRGSASRGPDTAHCPTRAQPWRAHRLP